MVERAGTVTFTHPGGKELDDKITRLYEEGAIAVTNFASSEDPGFIERVHKKVDDTLTAAWMDREELEQDWELFKALYDLINLDTAVRSNVDVHVPEVLKAVDIRVRELSLAIFSRDSWARAIPMDRASEKKAPKVTQFMLDQMRVEKFPVKFKQWLKGLVMYGTGCAVQTWDGMPKRVNAAEIEVEELENGQKKVTIRKSDDAARNMRIGQPTFMPVRIFDFVGDPNHFDVQKGTFVGHRVIMTRNQLLAMEDAGIYMNTRSIEATDIFLRPRHDDIIARHLTDELRHRDTTAATEQFEVWEVWVPFLLPETDRERECVITIERNSRTILRVSENPFWHAFRPYLVSQYIQDEDGGLYGRGVIEPIASLQMELDDTRNLALIAKDLLVNPMFTAPIEVDLPSERLIAIPGRILPPGIQPIPFVNNTFTAFQHEAVIKGDIREVVTTPAALSGAGQAGDETATENISRIQEAKSDTAEIARDISDLVLLPMLNMRHALNVQFMREERVFRKIGIGARPGEPLFDVIEPEDLIGDYMYEWEGLRDFAVKGKRVGLMRQVLDSLSRFPQLMQDQDAVDQGAIARDMVTELFDAATAAKFFPDLREKDILPAQLEHEMLALGGELSVHSLDNHFDHINIHKSFLRSPPKGFGIVKQGHLEAHVQSHLVEAQKQVNQLMRRAQQQQALAAQAGPMGAPAGGGPLPGQPRGQGGSRPRETVVSSLAPQAPEAQEAQISGAGVMGA